jgi:hypothetical protein
MQGPEDLTLALWQPPDKPKRMRWTTYRKLVQEFAAAKQAALCAMGAASEDEADARDGALGPDPANVATEIKSRPSGRLGVTQCRGACR